MKAKEYYAKYHDALNTAAPGAIQTQMLYDFRHELDAMQKQRHAVSLTAQNGITRELNDKWNAVTALFESKDGKSPITKDAFLNWRTKGTEKVKKTIQHTATRMPSYADRKAILMACIRHDNCHAAHLVGSSVIDHSNPNSMATMAMIGQMACSG